jgi:hypothetical protein
MVSPALSMAALYFLQMETLVSHEGSSLMSSLLNPVNREIFAVLKVGEFAFFQLAVDKIPRLLQKFNG